MKDLRNVIKMIKVPFLAAQLTSFPCYLEKLVIPSELQELLLKYVDLKYAVRIKKLVRLSPALSL